MKNVIQIFCILSLFLCSSAYSFELGQATQETINKFINQQEVETHGIYTGIKSYVKETDNSQTYIAVQYTLEGIRGGTDWLQYLVLFRKANNKTEYIDHIQIGGKGIRSAKLLKISNGIIEIRSKYHSISDPLCCPSLKAKSIIVVRNNKLEEKDIVINDTWETRGTSVNK